jgi:hypothetical protein
LNAYSTANMTSPFLSPEMPRAIQDALVVVTVESVSGSPTTVTISPMFQYWHSIIGGNQEEVIDGGSGISPTISWFTVAAVSNPSLLPDGDWPVAQDVSAAETANTPVSFARRIDGGFPWRLNVAWAFTGGTSPAMILSAIAYCREGPPGGFDRVESGA